MTRARASSVTARLGQPGWRGRSLRHLWQVPTFLVGLLALIVVTTGAALRPGTPTSDRDAELGHLRAALQRKLPLEGLLPRAEEVLARPNLPPRRTAELHFLLGEALIRRASELPAQLAHAERKKAIHHLEQAEKLGIAAANRARVWFLLGQALHLNEGDPQRVVHYLSRSAGQGADHPAEGYDLLMQAYLRLPTPDLETALQVNQKLLDSTTDEKVLTPARLLRAQLLARKGQHADALKVLDRIPSTAAPDIRRPATALQARCCEEERLWSRAIPLWTALLETPTLVPGGKAAIYHHLGLCQRNLEAPKLTEASKSWELAWKAGGEEGQAALLRLAELHLQQGQLEALTHDLKRALEQVKVPGDFNNKIIELPRVQQLVQEGLAVAQTTFAFPQGQTLAELSGKLHGPPVAERRMAENAAAWAEHLEKRVKMAPGEEVEQLRQEARAQWKRAGAAELEATRSVSATQQAEHLWRSLNYYRRAQEHGVALEVLQRYVQLPLSPGKLAEGWFVLAEARWALGKKEEARQAYFKCLEHPQVSFAYKARYKLALDQIESERYDLAEEYLEQNLRSTSPDLDREAHQNSLYSLAMLLYSRQSYGKAALLLKEATAQYPDDARILRARDELGDAYRRLADILEKKINPPASETTDRPTPNARSQYLRNQEEWRAHALDVYQKLADTLEQRQSRDKLEGLEFALLRKSQFAVADLHYDLRNFPESLRHYRQLAKLYQDRVEGLIACQRMWRCGSVMWEIPEQKQLLLEAVQEALKSVQPHLEKMRPEQFNGPAGSWTREEWVNWVKGVNAYLTQLPTTTLRPSVISNQ